MAKKKKGVHIGYMCGVDFQHEVEQDHLGTLIFPKLAQLKRKRTCWKECGIVEVECKIIRWVRKQDLLKGK